MLCHLESLKSWLNTSAQALREMKGWVQESPVWQLRWRFQQQSLGWQDSQNLPGCSFPPSQSSPCPDSGVSGFGMRNKTWGLIWQLQNTPKLKFISLLERFSPQPSPKNPFMDPQPKIRRHSGHSLLALGNILKIFWNIFCLPSGGRKLHLNHIPQSQPEPSFSPPTGCACKRIIKTWQSPMQMEMSCTTIQLQNIQSWTSLELEGVTTKHNSQKKSLNRQILIYQRQQVLLCSNRWLFFMNKSRQQGIDCPDRISNKLIQNYL